MNHILCDNALTVLRAQPFTADEMAQLEAAAAMLPWEQLAPMVNDLHNPALAESAKNAAFELIAQQEAQTKGLAGVCVLAAGMYACAERLAACGVSHTALNDTFCCLHRMCGEYRKEFNTFGFDRGFWVWRQACGRILRLGTLEFEYVIAGPNTDGKPVPEGKAYLSVHIPSGADLSREALDDSYAQARALFANCPQVCPPDGLAPEAIYCGSWLLCPTLRKLLKENSGIRRFAEDFELYRVQESSNGYRHFLFWAGEDTPIADYAEDTSLRRAVKAHLLNGGVIGSGSGLLKK